MEARQAQLTEFTAQNHRTLADLPSNVQANSAAIADLNREIDNEKMRQALLESRLNRLREAQLVPLSPRAVSTQLTVDAGGVIKLDNNHAFLAAGRTPAQLEAAIGGGATVRIFKSATQVVTVLVPLATARDRFHVFGEVTVANRKIVQVFENSISGQPAVAKAMPLRAGSYHLKVVVENVTSGVTHKSDLDFTVD